VEGGHGLRERNEWVMRVLKEWQFFPMLPCARFFSPTFLMHESLFSLIEPFTTINSASHLFNFQHSDHTIFLRQTSREDLIRPRSDHHISVPHQTILRPEKNTNHDNQAIRSATTTIADSQIRSSQQTTILDYSASNYPRITSLLEWYRLGAFLMGWVKGGI